MIDGLTIGDFVRWLKEQPPETKYYFPEETECACGLYARSMGVNYFDLPFELRSVANAAAWAARSDGDYGTLGDVVRYGELHDWYKITDAG